MNILSEKLCLRKSFLTTAVLLVIPMLLQAKENPNAKAKYGVPIALQGRACDLEQTAISFRSNRLPSASEWLERLKLKDFRIYKRLIKVERLTKVCVTSYIETKPGYQESKSVIQPALVFERVQGSRLKSMDLFIDSVSVLAKYNGEPVEGKEPMSEKEVSAVYLTELFHPLVTNDDFEESKIQNIVHSIINMDSSEEIFRSDAHAIGYPLFTLHIAMLDGCFADIDACPSLIRQLPPEKRLEFMLRDNLNPFGGYWYDMTPADKRVGLGRIMFSFIRSRKPLEDLDIWLESYFPEGLNVDIKADLKNYEFRLIRCSFGWNAYFIERCISFIKLYDLPDRMVSPAQPHNWLRSIFEISQGNTSISPEVLLKEYFLKVVGLKYFETYWKTKTALYSPEPEINGYQRFENQFQDAVNYIKAKRGRGNQGYFKGSDKVKNMDRNFKLIVSFLNIVSEEFPDLISSKERRKLNSLVSKMGLPYRIKKASK